MQNESASLPMSGCFKYALLGEKIPRSRAPVRRASDAESADCLETRIVSRGNELAVVPAGGIRRCGVAMPPDAPPFRREAMIAVRSLLAVVALLSFTGCAGEAIRRSSAVAPTPDPAQIRVRLEEIRSAIVQKNAAGIVRYATNDWVFRTPDGATYDRAAYLRRAEGMFATMDIESLDTRVESVAVAGDGRARVAISQLMVRRERVDGREQRVRLSYAERQTWVWKAAEWRVSRVEIVAPATRQVLP